MTGLINRTVECFVRDSYGEGVWLDVMRRLDLGYVGFEAMLDYDPAITERLLAALAGRLDRSVAELQEDVGTYLVSHPNTEALRRLLRFGGVDFADFLHSLDDLPERARLALSDLALPAMTLRDRGGGLYTVSVGTPRRPLPLRLGHVVIGLLRAMADDYGALVLLEHKGRLGAGEDIEVRLLDRDFAAGRRFELGAMGG